MKQISFRKQKQLLIFKTTDFLPHSFGYSLVNPLHQLQEQQTGSVDYQTVASKKAKNEGKHTRIEEPLSKPGLSVFVHFDY